MAVATFQKCVVPMGRFLQQFPPEQQTKLLIRGMRSRGEQQQNRSMSSRGVVQMKRLLRQISQEQLLIRCMSSQTARHSNMDGMTSLGVMTSLDVTTAAKLKKYSDFSPHPLSINNFVRAAESTGDEQDLFLRTEILIRLANMFMELQHLPEQIMRKEGFQDILKLYIQSFTELLELGNMGSRDKFLHSLGNIRQRHANTVIAMSAVAQNVADANIDQKYINNFLDRFYTSRISIHMLISHYQELHTPTPKNTPKHIVGTFNSKCDITEIVKNAYGVASLRCDQEYMDHPELRIITHGDPTISCVPSHLHHIFFEMFKNAMRATCEHAEKQNVDDLPEVVCTIVRCEDELNIKISDRGGGMDRKTLNKVFDYHFTTVGGTNDHVLGAGGLESGAHPMHGLGYGLPLSRLYARYFQGDIDVTSMRGLGTDVNIYLRAMSQKASERIPIYGPLAVYNMERRASNQEKDWIEK